MRWKPQLPRNVLEKRATLPRRPLRLRKLKDRRTGICLPWLKCSHSHPLCYTKLKQALPATSWKHRSLRFQVEKRATLPRRPLRLRKLKDRRTGICLPWSKCSHSHLLCYTKLKQALPATSWKRQSLRFQLQERATLPRRPLCFRKLKDQRTSICLPSV